MPFYGNKERRDDEKLPVLCTLFSDEISQCAIIKSTTGY
jgi:hypothetical protein